jgi:hypothetical protein
MIHFREAAGGEHDVSIDDEGYARDKYEVGEGDSCSAPLGGHGTNPA